MTASDIPPRSRLARDVTAVFLVLVGLTAVIWAAAVTDWRLLLGVLGLIAVSVGVTLARGSDE